MHPMRGINAKTGKALSGQDHLRQSIRDILLTPLGSRVMRRDYGSRLLELVDAPMNRRTLLDLYASVVDAINKWEPRYLISKVVATKVEPGIVELTLTGSYEEKVVEIVVTTQQTVATPGIVPSAGSILTTNRVTLTCATLGAVIRYTIDGSTPSNSSPIYTAPLQILSSATVKAMATKVGSINSDVSTASFVVPNVAAPVITPGSGTIQAGDSISIACATSGASIYYTIDGSTPTIGSTLYSGAFTVSGATTVKAIAVKLGYLDSAITVATLTVNLVDSGGWWGAYDFATAPAQNIVTGAALQNYTVGGALDSITGGSYHGSAAPSDIGSGSATLPTGYLGNQNAVSFAMFVTVDPGQDAWLRPGFNSGGLNGLKMNLGGGVLHNEAYVNNTQIGSFAPMVVSGRHHYAVTIDTVAGEMKLYRDGSLLETLLFAGSPIGSTCNGVITAMAAIGSGGYTAQIDNLVYYVGELSDAAIASLAAGNMPNASGILTN